MTLSNNESHLSSIFHRVDDIGTVNHSDYLLIDELESCQRPYILCVIPRRLANETATLLRSLRYAHIFQHGYSHVAACSSNPKNEFPDTLDNRKILNALSNGRTILQQAIGNDIRGYTPPWNRGSGKLDAALVELSYKYISAKFPAISSAQLQERHVHVDCILDYTNRNIMTVDQVWKTAIVSMQSHSITGIVHHPKNYTDTYITALGRMCRATRDFCTEQSVWK